MRIAQRLGHASPKLQIQKRRVYARTDLAARRLLAEVLRERLEERALPAICIDCGFSHAQADRVAYLRRVLPCSLDELREAHPCWWDAREDRARERTLYRDLRKAGAVRQDGVWGRPSPAREIAA